MSRVQPNEDGSGNVLLNICKYMEGEQRTNRCKDLLNAGGDLISRGSSSLLGSLANDQTVDFSFLFDEFPKQCHIDYSDKNNFWFFASLLCNGNKDMIRFVLDNQ